MEIPVGNAHLGQQAGRHAGTLACSVHAHTHTHTHTHTHLVDDHNYTASSLRHKIEDHLTRHRLNLSLWFVYKSTPFFSAQVCVIIFLAKLQIV